MKQNGKHETSPSGLRAARRDSAVAAIFAGVNAEKHSKTDETLRELATIGEVCVHIMDNGNWWVNIKPNQYAPLWWYSSKPKLLDALLDCRRQAVEMRFLK